MKTYIYGKHPVLEALHHAPHVVKRVFADMARHEEIVALAKKRSIPCSPFDERALSREAGDGAVHQGVAAIIDSEKLMTDLASFLSALLTSNIKSADVRPAYATASAGRRPESVGLAILGEVQDPQNVGSIIRSAVAFGLSGVLIPKDRQAQITGAAIKASVGAAFRIPLVAIGNVNQTVRELKEHRFWVYGLSGEAERNIRDEDFSENTVFVVGNEARGLREKTGEHCDAVLKIPITENIESLNAGTAAAIAFYEWHSKQHI